MKCFKNFKMQGQFPSTGFSRPEKELIEGTVSRDLYTLFFSIKQLYRFPIDMPRKDFEFCGIFVNLFVFVLITGGFFEYVKIILQNF